MKKIISSLLICCMLAASLCIFPANAADGADFVDPAEGYEPTAAANEDASLDLWFDYTSEKISPDSTTSTGRKSATVYMAKNEIEDAQFVLCTTDNTGRDGLSASFSGFTDNAGNTLDADIFIELYHDCGTSGSVPDAIPPLSAYGPFSLTAGKSQAFLIKITSKSDTAAGLYSSDLTVTDASGNAIKTTKVFAKVWDFALSDETACATSMNLAYSYLTSAYPGRDANEIYKNYYDYLLENRVCAYYLPYNLYDTKALDYMDNPRVTSFQGDRSYTGTSYQNSIVKLISKKAYKGSENAHRFNKAYYFSNIVDAAKPADLEKLREYYNNLNSWLSASKPDYADVPFWFINTYINDIDYTDADGNIMDQIAYYDDFVNLWCSKTFAYTRSDELGTAGAKLMQPQKWDSIYGTFAERMQNKRDAGQKVWWFISWDVEAPYINYYMQTDGVAQRVLFWQQYDNGVQGFLYNFANFWSGDCYDPYANNITNSAYPNAHGESILIYPGAKYGLDTPVGSLRLEAMRDGIEDYQLFTMLDAALGDGASDEYIDRMTTGMVTYSVSDSDYSAARVALGDAVENALSTENCEHDYTCEITIPATCTEAGEAVYTCAKCGKSYTDAVPAAGHTFTGGKCSVCGADDPNAVTLKLDGTETVYSAGDAVKLEAVTFYRENFLSYRFTGWSGDEDIIGSDPNATAIEFTMPAKNVSLTQNYLIIGDINSDGNVNGIDLNLMRRMMIGLYPRNDSVDINYDDNMNSIDLNLMRRMMIGLYIPTK